MGVAVEARKNGSSMDPCLGTAAARRLEKKHDDQATENDLLVRISTHRSGG